MSDIHEQILTMMQADETPVLSLYQRTYRKGADVDQGPIQFKNLVREAEEKLEDRLERRELEKLREALEAIRKDVDFWRHRTEGLAIFAYGDKVETFDLTKPVEDKVVVGKYPHVLPLIEAYQALEPHYILELQKDNFTLFEGDGLSRAKIESETLPKSFRELFDDLDADANVNVGSYAGRQGAYHGHRAKPEETEKDKKKYYRYLESELTPFFEKHGVPVVLAGVQENIADWRHITSSDIYLEQSIDKPLRDLEDHELAERIEAIFEAVYTARIERQMESLQGALADDRASTAQDGFGDALAQGRVAELLYRTAYKPERREQLDAWVHDCYLQGGEVMAVPVTTRAMDKPAAVIYRY